MELKRRFAGFTDDDALNGAVDSLTFVRVDDTIAKLRARSIKSA